MGSADDEPGNGQVVFLSFSPGPTLSWLNMLQLRRCLNGHGVDSWIDSPPGEGAYAIDLHDDQVRHQIDALSDAAVAELANVLARIAVDPWDSEPMVRRNENASVRTLGLGDAGFVVFLVLDLPGLCRVDLLQVVWFDERA